MQSLKSIMNETLKLADTKILKYESPYAIMLIIGPKNTNAVVLSNDE